MMRALRAVELGPCAASVSGSAAVASPAVVTVEGVCVIFSTPTTRARSTSPDPTAWTPARKAAPPAPPAVFADLPGGHLDWRADLDRLVPEVGELGRDHRAFFKSDHRDGVGGVGLVAGGGVVDGGVGVDLAAPAELVFCARLTDRKSVG